MSEKKTVVRTPTRLALVEFARASHHVTVENGVTKAMLEKPDFWAHISELLKSGDHIEIVPKDRHFFAEVFVLAASSGWAKVKMLRYTTLIKDTTKTKDENFQVEWNGTEKWRVLEGDEILTKDHETKELALAWLKEHKRKLK